MDEIRIIAPDDWHLHLRDDVFLELTVKDSAKHFNRALIMPNLNPPISTVKEALLYRKRILQALDSTQSFTPYMALFLQSDTSTKDVVEAANHEFIKAFKYYPANATTQSHSGIDNIANIMPILEQIAQANIVLCIHGEVTDKEIDAFDKEARFIDNILDPLIKTLPNLKIVLEHISTAYGVEFIKQAPNVCATITAHHLLLNRNDLINTKLYPHHFCLPVLKRKSDQIALRQAAVSGNPKFFLGTDSAPHKLKNKASNTCCAGIYTAYNAIELYAMAFEKENALEKLENFASCFGAKTYGLPISTQYLTLQRKPQVIPESLKVNDIEVVPLFAGSSIPWSVTSQIP